MNLKTPENAVDALYAINDALSMVCNEVLDVEWDSDEQEDNMLNELTHHIADRLRVQTPVLRRPKIKEDQ